MDEDEFDYCYECESYGDDYSVIKRQGFTCDSGAWFIKLMFDRVELHLPY